MRIWGSGIGHFGSGMETVRIRDGKISDPDKHPGSATLKKRKVVSVLPLSLAQLASMAENMERGGGGATQHNFTLADLISNVSEVRDSGV
jgi:hypothetical protein